MFFENFINPNEMTLKYSKEDLLKSGVRCMYIDTHTHTKTKGSDGVFEPVAQVEYAYQTAYNLFKEEMTQKGLSNDENEIIAYFIACVDVHWCITDHNTAMAYEVLHDAGIQLPSNFHLHTGVELEARDENNNIFDVTISGITRDYLNSFLGQHYIDDVVEEKANLEDRSAEIQYKAFKNLGLTIPELMDPKQRYRITGVRANDLAHDIMHKMLFENPESTEFSEVREYLLSNGYNPNRGRNTYYRKFVTNSNTPFYVDQSEGRLTLKQIAYFILKYTNALLFVSHPGVYEKEKYGTMQEFIEKNYKILLEVSEKLSQEGISTERRFGFECGHRGMSLEQTEWVMHFCKEHNLIYSSESDFHTPKSAGQVPFTINGGKTFITSDLVSPEWFNTTLYQEW